MAEQIDWFRVPVTTLELSIRGRHIVRKTMARTIGDLCQLSVRELLTSKSYGETSLIEIHEQLAARGLRLRDDKAGPGARPRKRRRRADERRDWSVVPVAQFDPSPLAQYFLERMHFETIGDLCLFTSRGLRSATFSEAVYEELLDVLAACGQRPRVVREG